MAALAARAATGSRRWSPRPAGPASADDSSRLSGVGRGGLLRCSRPADFDRVLDDVLERRVLRGERHLDPERRPPNLARAHHPLDLALGGHPDDLEELANLHVEAILVHGSIPPAGVSAALCLGSRLESPAPRTRNLRRAGSGKPAASLSRRDGGCAPRRGGASPPVANGRPVRARSGASDRRAAGLRNSPDSPRRPPPGRSTRPAGTRSAPCDGSNPPRELAR